ncbi:MAG TPA: hypothetical protein VF472_20925 [Burkholderiaceae bacterium]
MARKPLSGEDLVLLNAQIQSRDRETAGLAKRILLESVQDASRFADSTVQEWARRIVKRESRSSMH